MQAFSWANRIFDMRKTLYDFIIWNHSSLVGILVLRNIGIVQKFCKWHSQNRHLDTKLYLEAMLGIQLWPSTSKLHLEIEIGMFAAIKIWITQKVSDLSIEPSFVSTYLMMAIVFLVLLTSSTFTGRDTIFAKWIPDNLLWKVFPIFCGGYLLLAQPY